MSINATNSLFSHSLLTLGSVLVVEDDTPYYNAISMTTRDKTLLTVDGYGNFNVSNGYLNIEESGAHIGKNLLTHLLTHLLTYLLTYR